MLRSVFGFAALALLSLPAMAQDSTTNPCTAYITSVPFDINSPGHYCLRGDLTTTSFRGVNIQSSDVTLNCRSRAITTTNRDAGSDGIVVMGELSNVTVQNCRVNNFDRGISGGFSGNNLQVMNNHVDNSISAGISVWGHGTRVASNRVTNTHHFPGQQSIGINLLPFSPEVSATGQELINNVVASSYGSDQVVGIQISGATNPRVANNVVADLRPDAAGYAVGLWLSGWAQGADTTGVVLVNNSFVSRGSSMQGMWGQPQVCRGNVAIGVSPGTFAACISNIDNTEIP
jgi:hypothetical protein